MLDESAKCMVTKLWYLTHWQTELAHWHTYTQAHLHTVLAHCTGKQHWHTHILNSHPLAYYIVTLHWHTTQANYTGILHWHTDKLNWHNKTKNIHMRVFLLHFPFEETQCHFSGVLFRPCLTYFDLLLPIFTQYHQFHCLSPAFVCFYWILPIFIHLN